MEGTISLGIFDEKGKLVRVLHREAKIDNFSAEADGLSTTWDGKNDVGGDLPPGKYRARGYAVGQDIKAQHIAYFFNDFVTDQKSTRFGNILQIWYDNGQLRIAARRFKEEPSEFDINGKLITEDASIPVKCEETPELPQIVDPITCDFGKDETLWVLDHAEKDSPRIAIRQFSETKGLLREVAVATEDPQPNDLAASDTEDRIYLLEENDAMQRLRSLTFTAGKNDYKSISKKRLLNMRISRLRMASRFRAQVKKRFLKSSRQNSLPIHSSATRARSSIFASGSTIKEASSKQQMVCRFAR